MHQGDTQTSEHQKPDTSTPDPRRRDHAGHVITEAALLPVSTQDIDSKYPLSLTLLFSEETLLLLTAFLSVSLHLSTSKDL